MAQVGKMMAVGEDMLAPGREKMHRFLVFRGRRHHWQRPLPMMAAVAAYRFLDLVSILWLLTNS